MKLTLVPVTDTEENWCAVRAAMMVARRFNGHADAIYVHSDVDMDISTALQRVDHSLREELVTRFRQQVESQVDQVCRKFENIAAEHHVNLSSEPMGDGAATASWQIAEHQMLETLRTRAGVYDAVILAQGDYKTPADWQPSVEAVLFATGRPVLLVPHRDLESIGDTVLIGWNRTAPSARAMFGALPFLQQAKQVVIFSVKTGAKLGPPPQAAARLLSYYDIAATVEEVSPARDTVAKQLLSKAQDISADLVVMGAYSHSRFREIILGGVTKNVLHHAECPVFLAH